MNHFGQWVYSSFDFPRIHMSKCFTWYYDDDYSDPYHNQNQSNQITGTNSNQTLKQDSPSRAYWPSQKIQVRIQSMVRSSHPHVCHRHSGPIARVSTSSRGCKHAVSVIPLRNNHRERYAPSIPRLAWRSQHNGIPIWTNIPPSHFAATSLVLRIPGCSGDRRH